VILLSRPLDVWAAFLHDAEVGRAIVDVKASEMIGRRSEQL
jgi:hypothetical protein